MPADPLNATAVLGYVWQHSPVLALQLDAQQRVLSANAEAVKVLGADILGRPLAELTVGFVTAPADGEEGEQLLSLKTVRGLPASYRFRRCALGEGELALGHPDFPELERLQTELLDLNRELGNLTRQLHQANAELRELNQLKNQFLGMAAHDLRKPVGLIMTFTETVLDETAGQMAPAHEDYLRTCLKAATDMSLLIDHFLDVAVIESGQLRLDLAPATGRDITEAVAPVARLLAAKKKVALQIQEESGARTQPVDASKIQQALLNLVANAIEHSPPGRSVWVSARWAGEELVWAVRDEGAGITAEDQARLFAPFVRAGARKTAGERSTGLGLTIARLIVQAHGGRLEVDSAPGQGATFRFFIPRPPPL